MLDAANPLRLLIPALLAAAAALWVDRATEARGFSPPGFDERWRRIAGMAVLGGIFFLGIFLPVGMIGVEQAPTPETLDTPRLFLLQGLLVLSLFAWFVVGYAGRTPRPLGRELARQIGWKAERPWVEVGLGLAAGIAGWIVVIVLMVVIAMTMYLVGGENLVPTQPPEMVPLIAGLPWYVRLGLVMSAGVVEESFFRGLLQPRVGIAFSTGVFVLAHLSYGQPFMLIGICALSLVFAYLVRWRRSVLASVVAHATFDFVQLLVIIPLVLRYLPEMTERGADATAATTGWIGWVGWVGSQLAGLLHGPVSQLILW